MAAFQISRFDEADVERAGMAALMEEVAIRVVGATAGGVEGCRWGMSDWVGVERGHGF